MNILCTILARSGSKRLFGKHLLPLCGKPLICRTVDAAVEWSGLSHQVVVCTDDDLIAKLVEETYPSISVIGRPPETCRDETPKMVGIRYACKTMEELFDTKYDVILDLDASAPLRRQDDIVGAVAMFKNSSPDVVVSVAPSRRNNAFNRATMAGGNSVNLCAPYRGATGMQNCTPEYDLNASIYIYSRDCLFNTRNHPLMSKAMGYIMPDWTAYDVDNHDDLEIVRALWEGHRNELEAAGN